MLAGNLIREQLPPGQMREAHSQLVALRLHRQQLIRLPGVLLRPVEAGCFTSRYGPIKHAKSNGGMSRAKFTRLHASRLLSTFGAALVALWFVLTCHTVNDSILHPLGHGRRDWGRGGRSKLIAPHANATAGVFVANANRVAHPDAAADAPI